jgi:hypothetical protein
VPENLFAGAVEKQNAALEVRGDQAAAHGVNDVFGEILEAEEFLAFLLQFPPLAAKGLSKQAGKIGNREKSKEIHDQPGAQALDCRKNGKGARDFRGKCQEGHAGKDQETNGGNEESYPARKKDAPDKDHQKVEQDEIALLQAGGIDQQRHHDYVAGNLQTAVPARFREPAQKDEMKNSYGDPENNKREEETVGTETWHILRPNDTYGQNESDRQ